MNMSIIGMLCPHCGDTLKSDGAYTWPEQWIGWIVWVCCEPCERFFYILSDEDQYPLTVVDAEAGRGIGEGDEGYSFDPAVNGEDDDDEGWYYYQQWKASQPKCALCGVRKPIEHCDRCQKCVERFGMCEAVQS